MQIWSDRLFALSQGRKGSHYWSGIRICSQNGKVCIVAEKAALEHDGALLSKVLPHLQGREGSGPSLPMGTLFYL